ncbi:MAG: FAD-dependent oxidoreductase [Burkholderiales bacterium]|nr:FAD-dependent oxidoreductase [Burkholderiales bacterium]
MARIVTVRCAHTMPTPRVDSLHHTSPPSLSRRDWLTLVATGAAAALTGCASRPQGLAEPSVPYLRPHSNLPFARPDITMDRIANIRVGFRPYREQGFVVRGERMGDKVVIHNYGHGGAGITLSWGSSMLALRELPDGVDKRAAVLGGGVMGLTTAALLIERGWQVTLYARELPPHTTSDVAGGFWAPTAVFQQGQESAAFRRQLDEALRLSHDAFLARLGKGHGVSWRESYYFSSQATPSPFYLQGWPQYFPATEVLSAERHPFASAYTLRTMSLFIEPNVMLQRLLQDLDKAGARIVRREVRDLAELLTLPESVVFNCTGLGAAALFGDAGLQPVRGQLVLLPPDERIDFVTHGGGMGLLYMFPRADALVLGGTFERGATHVEPDEDTTRRIIEQHATLFEAMHV